MSCSTMPGGRRRLRGGNFYGAAVDPQIGSAGLAYPSVENLAANPVTGALIPNDGVRGGRRRRGGKSSKKTTRKTKRRNRRGGNDDDPTVVEEEGTPIEESTDNPTEDIQRGGRHRKTRRRRGGDEEGSGPGETAAGKGDDIVQTSFGPMTSTEILAANAALNSLPPQLRPRQGGKKSRRKSKKSGKKGGRKSRRKMRGGNYVSSANVGASYQGSGVAGLANYSPYAPNVPGGGPQQNADGVYSA